MYMFGKRHDGRRLRNIDPIVQFTPYIMPHRDDAQVFTRLNLDFEGMTRYIRDKRREGCNVTYMTLILAAYVRTVCENPEINRFIINKRLYSRNHICVSFVTLKKGAKNLEFTTTVNNTVLDHRLRAMFRTDLKEAMVCRADSPFDVVRRDIPVPDSSGWYEEAARTWPSHSFVSVSDGKETVTVTHKGIPEYEVTDDETRTVALTLLRCVRNAGNPTAVYA